jgi:hypothetical protein
MNDSVLILPHANDEPRKNLGPNMNELVERVRATGVAFKEAERQLVIRARDWGFALLDARPFFVYGTWLAFLKDCGFSETKARRCMTIAENYATILKACGLPNSSRVTNLMLDELSVNEALRLIYEAEGKPERPAIFEGKKCRCGADLMRTSSRWSTCQSCFDARLYGNEVPGDPVQTDAMKALALLSQFAKLVRKLPPRDHNWVRTKARREIDKLPEVPEPSERQLEIDVDDATTEPLELRVVA